MRYFCIFLLIKLCRFRVNLNIEALAHGALAWTQILVKEQLNVHMKTQPYQYMGIFFTVAMNMVLLYEHFGSHFYYCRMINENRGL